MKEAIKLAIEGGWKGLEWNGVMQEYRPEVVLDPLFWQALGKAEGWGNSTKSLYHSIGRGNGKPIYSGELYEVASWMWNWHRLIDHLAEGKEVEEFFSNLIKSNE